MGTYTGAAMRRAMYSLDLKEGLFSNFVPSPAPAARVEYVTKYICAATRCGYETVRKSELVRHIRSRHGPKLIKVTT